MTVKTIQINEKIPQNEVQVIDIDGNDIGIKSLKEALELAYNSSQDLVPVSTKKTPWVCKIMDYDKKVYEQKRKEKNQHKNKPKPLKELVFSPAISEHDISYRVSNSKKFLSKGHPLKLTIRFKGRENFHKDLGNQLMDKLIQELSEVAEIQKEATIEGNQLSVILIAKK